MYIKTNTQYTIFENDKLTDLLSKINNVKCKQAINKAVVKLLKIK